MAGKHLVQAQPLVYTLQCLTGKRDNNITWQQIAILTIAFSFEQLHFHDIY